MIVGLQELTEPIEKDGMVVNDQESGQSGAGHGVLFRADLEGLQDALEHGAVVFWYNCPEGCADEVAQAQAMIDSLPLDPLCAGTGTPRRAVLVPNPDLDARWAASAWGYLDKASCFDEAVLRSFYAEHYGKGPEALCGGSGVTLTPSSCP